MYDYPSDDEESISPELEAELYSKIHYGDYEEEHADNNVFIPKITESCAVQISSPEITENVSLDVLNEVVNSKNNSPDDLKNNIPIAEVEESKYRHNAKICTIDLNSHSSDSEDDSGIQIVRETKKQSKKPLVLNLADSNSSDSEVEHLPSFKRPAPTLIVGKLILNNERPNPNFTQLDFSSLKKILDIIILRHKMYFHRHYY